jgi:hypothetical protein
MAQIPKSKKAAEPLPVQPHECLFISEQGHRFRVSGKISKCVSAALAGLGFANDSANKAVGIFAPQLFQFAFGSSAVGNANQ